MRLLNQVTNASNQKQNILLPDGTQIELKIQFKPMQFGWFITSLTWQNVVIEGMRLCVNPNILRQFKNQIPFGIACFSQASREPMFQDDFSSRVANLYLLSEEEVQEYEDYLSGQTG